MRTATVPWESPRSQASVGACSTTRVSPPGQNARTSVRMKSGTVVIRPSIPLQEPTSTGTGMSRSRPFAIRMQVTASGVNASAPSPYTVSVGRTTSRPSAMASAAAPMPRRRRSGCEQSKIRVIATPFADDHGVEPARTGDIP